MGGIRIGLMIDHSVIFGHEVARGPVVKICYDHGVHQAHVALSIFNGPSAVGSLVSLSLYRT